MGTKSRQRPPKAVETRPGVSASAIAHRAYEIYQARGEGEGRALDDWFEAERQLKQPKDPEEGG
jgi:hypothetical protein